ncbi:extracellular solute-binding protein [Nesterenkonia sp. CL21]|uniref:extracellular solute-binding protein n=1 Tax=Nesterenkonia sp. CL21 TaxID=3064894 RepID=UPI002879CFE6|nr:extracellular solute-binding protein [Nesterenkonia sp. CL21]MDS2173537.1 extracellular solute-binding protein [Nesterenkonia sp. CL21]
MKKTATTTVGALSAAVLALTACGGGDAAAGDDEGFSLDVPDIPALEELGEPEGQVNIVAWPGFVEDGTNNPDADWVTEFTEQTGCEVNRRIGETSDQMVSLMRSGDYDLISASGDASLRLIAGGDVAPINLDLLENFDENIAEGMIGQVYDTINGDAYGVPLGRGANILQYNEDEVEEAPTSWDVTWEADSPYAGEIIAYDSPIYIADAALYLMHHEPDLGIENPYALDEEQLDAAVELLQQQNEIVSEYWALYTANVSSFQSGSSTLGTSWQVILNVLGDGYAGVLPEEGATGWSDAWMIHSESPNTTCAYLWMDWATSPEINAQIAQNFGMAPANTLACEGSRENEEHCEMFHATDEDYYSQVWFWTTPIEQCLDGRTDVTCTNYQQWTEAWARVKG